MELVDGGDVGEDEPDHVLGEGLAATGLLQQLLEEHLQPPQGQGACAERKPAPQQPRGTRTAPRQAPRLLSALTSLVLPTTPDDTGREDCILATLQMGKPWPRDSQAFGQRQAADECQEWARLGCRGLRLCQAKGASAGVQ